MTLEVQYEPAPKLTGFGEHDAETDTMGEELVPKVNVTVANFVGSCTEVAVTVVYPEAGAVDGAVYAPLCVIVPAEALHVTAEL